MVEAVKCRCGAQFLSLIEGDFKKCPKCNDKISFDFGDEYIPPFDITWT